jgi:hypothetical protein
MKTTKWVPWAVGLGAVAAYVATRELKQAPKPEAPKPEAAKPEAPKPEAPKGPTFKGVVLAGDSLMVGAANALKLPNKRTTAVVGAPVSNVPKQLRDVPLKGFDTLVISGGINDLAGGASVDEVLARVEKAWQAGKDRGFRIAHLQLTPTGSGKGPFRIPEDKRVGLNAALKARAAEKGVSWIDTSDLVDPSDATQLQPLLAAPDKLHLTPAGYAVLAGKIQQWLDGLAA